jgi:hypothetical protein
MSYYSTISGILKDPDGIAWKQATWTAVPVSPSSRPVFPDGTPVPATSGNLDALGTFSGQVPQTSSIRPPGTTLTITITSLTSYAPVTLTQVQILAATTDLGALLSARIPAPRIQCGPIVYAYDAIELIKPVHGNGYVNTYLDRSFMFMQNTWVMLGATGDFDALTAKTLDVSGPITANPGPISTTGDIVAANIPTGNAIPPKYLMTFATPFVPWLSSSNYRIGAAAAAMRDVDLSASSADAQISVPCDCVASTYIAQFQSQNVAAIPSGELIEVRLFNYTTAATLLSFSQAWGTETSVTSTGAMSATIAKANVVGAIVIVPGMTKAPTATAYSLQILCY